MARPHRALIEVAAGRPLPPISDLDTFVESALEHRMAGLVFTRIQNGEFRPPRTVLHRLAREDLRTQAHHRALWDTLETVARRLRASGFEVATAKGVTAEARWYDRPGERPCIDLDLLMAPDDIARIDDAVRCIDPGHVLLPTMRSLVTRGYVQWIDVFVSGTWIDLHADLFKLGIPTRGRDVIWERASTLTLPHGGTVKVPDAETSLVHFLLHLNHDRFAYLLGFADVARILQREQLDWAFIDSFIRNEGLETPFYLALDTVVDRLGLCPPRPCHVAGWRAVAWKVLWPSTSTLQAQAGAERERRRHFCLPLLARHRGREAWRWLLRRTFPASPLLDHWYGISRSPYLWRLLVGRLKKVRRHRALQFV